MRTIIAFFVVNGKPPGYREFPTQQQLEMQGKPLTVVVLHCAWPPVLLKISHDPRL
jgi:hypothetical protein